MMRKRHIKLLAAVTVVLLTLSGFSQARGSGGRGGGSKSHSSGGGGCSSKNSSSHSGSSDSYDKGKSDSYDGGRSDRYDSGDGGYRRGSRYNSSNGGSGSTSGGGSSRGTRSATGSLVECAAASQDRPSATVRVRNSGSRSGTFTVKVRFRDAKGGLLDTGSAVTRLRGDGTQRVRVRMEDPTLVSQVSRCELASVR